MGNITKMVANNKTRQCLRNPLLFSRFVQSGRSMILQNKLTKRNGRVVVNGGDVDRNGEMKVEVED